MGIWYKGFNKDLKCRNYQFDVNVLHKHEGKLRICNEGFHYCRRLEDVGTYYFFSPSNRFFLVKAKYYAGDKYNHNDKSVTDEIVLVKEIPMEIINKYNDYRKNKNSDPDQVFNLKEYQSLQKAYPDMILGGSSALYLHGFNIQRTKTSDFDVVLPKYTKFELGDFSPEDGVTEIDNILESAPSGNDFDYVAGINIQGNFMLIDVKIDNKARYEIIEYNGFKYKVCPWKVIIEAKLKYTDNPKTGKKHKQDFKDMFNLKPLEKKELINPLEEFIKDETIS